MKVIIQRVARASVTVDGKLISEIGQGLCVLVGICQSDTLKDVEFVCKKIVNTRLFEQDEKRWMKSVKDLQLEILCISQFTLYSKIKKNKPDFHQAMSGETARILYNQFLAKLGNEYDSSKIKDGVFGAMMEVHIVNSGPVTIEVESQATNVAPEDHCNG